MCDAIVIVPTLNPGHEWQSWMDAYRVQTVCPPCRVIDSASDDDVVQRSIDNGFEVSTIQRKDFDHGATRNLAMADSDSEFVIFLTQDALLQDDRAIENLLACFSDAEVAAAYGRQVPRPQADVFEAFIRLHNYPDESWVRSLDDREKYGIKTAFMSNSFAAYRREALQSIDGFPDGQVFGEDMVAAALMLKQGGKIAYAADACVYHSHDYSVFQEMKRYFDMGVFHAREPWIKREFGGAEKEGWKFVISEFKYLLRKAPWRIPEGFLRTVLKYIGFRLGRMEKHIPSSVKKKISMNPGFFNSL